MFYHARETRTQCYINSIRLQYSKCSFLITERIESTSVICNFDESCVLIYPHTCILTSGLGLYTLCSVSSVALCTYVGVHHVNTPWQAITHLYCAIPTSFIENVTFKILCQSMLVFPSSNTNSIEILHCRITKLYFYLYVYLYAYSSLQDCFCVLMMCFEICVRSASIGF